MHVSRSQELEAIAQGTWQDYHSGNKEALSDFYSLIMPFCLRVSSKTCGKYIGEFDEEASISRLAMLEAFEKYNPQRGSFLLYLAQVVRSRIIDYQRKEKKRPIPFSLLSEKTYKDTGLIQENQIEEIIDELSRKEEIYRFKTLLARFDIDFKDLVTSGPRQAGAREKALAIARLIVSDEEITGWLMEKKMLPIKEMERRFAVNRKTVDRYRKYIIAAVLVETSDLPFLKNYLKPHGKENING
jgi:RNA polymerase sigma factor